MAEHQLVCWALCTASLLLLPLHTSATHYACGGDEVIGEVLGETGLVCGPKCTDGTFECPTDVPDGSTAKPQCVLQDVDSTGYCGLFCQSDSQCPSGASCRTVGTAGISVCFHPLSFADWAKQGTRKKLAVGWPTKVAGSNSAKGFQIAKAYSALLSLKRRYSMADGDADVLTVKELLSAMSTASAAKPQSSGQPNTTSGGFFSAPPLGNRPSGQSLLDPWKRDVGYFANNMASGLPGWEKEVASSLNTLEHLDQKGKFTTTFRVVVLWLLVYLIGGSAYKYQAMGARGLEMVPHIGFWQEYPALVADGIKYLPILLAGFFAGNGMGGRGGGFASSGTSDRDTFAHFEPSK